MTQFLKRIAIVTLTVLMCLTGLDVQVKAASPTDGDAYAILTDQKELVFFRSTNKYEENEETVTVTDINGKNYTGIVFTDVEQNGFIDNNIIDHYKYRIEKVYVAENTVIKLKNTAYMFSEMRQMTSFNAKGFDTSEATNMESMFEYCNSIEELDLSTFDTAKVTNMIAMFYGCYNLKKLDISSFDTGNIEEMYNMFESTPELVEIKLGPKFTTFGQDARLGHGTWTNGTIKKRSWELCEEYPANAASWAGTWTNVIAKIERLELFDAVVSVGREVGISWTWDPNDYKVNGNFIWKSEDESIAKLYSENRGMVRGISPGITTISATTTDGSNITATCTVRVVENIAVAILQDNGDLVFFRAKEIPNDLYDGDVTEVTDIKGNTYKGQIFTNFEEMNFNQWNYNEENAAKVKKAYVAEGSTIYPTDLQNFFWNCVNMTEADMRGFNTETVTAFAHMFANCKSLEKIDLSTFTISDKAGYLYNMFGGCDSLTTLVLGSGIKHLQGSINLPNGIWKNGSISKSASELANNYNSDLAGTWIRKIAPATSLKFDQDVYEVEQDFGSYLKYTITPEDSSSGLEWESSDPSVVEVVDNGVVVGRVVGGTATITVRTTDGTNLSATCTVKVVERQERYYAYRVSGANRYKTSLEIATVFCEWWGEEKVDNIVLAFGGNFADALAGSYLAAVKSAPIVIINDRNIDLIKKYVKNYLAENGTIYILGGTAAVSDKVETEMKKLTKSIKRLAGNNRYGTNLAILNEAGMDSDTILVATGTNFADSLSASATGYPMLLVKDALTAEQKAFLKKNSDKKIYILGGTSAVNSTVEKELKSYGKVQRLAGASRFETSVLIAEKFFESPYGAVVAYSNDYPDGLCGGPLGYKEGIPLLLTRSDKLDAARKYIKDNGIMMLDVLGGDARLTNKDIKKLFGNKEVNYYHEEYKD